VASERVARLTNFDADSEILAFQNKKAYAIAAGAWTEVVGPGGGSATTRAFNTNTAASIIEETQWQHHAFLASDSGDPVIKMFRDSGGTMRLRTAGLPEFTSSLTPTDGGLALAIALANDLRTQMIAHYGSNGASTGTVETVSTKSHTTHADLTAQAAAVTASVAATNLATLITLLNILRDQYTLHVTDAQIQENPTDTRASAAFKRNYHIKAASAGTFYTLHAPPNNTLIQPFYYWTHFLNLSIEDQSYSIPSTAVIADVLPFLNDLREKWNWHQYSTITHYNAWRYAGTESYTQLGVHATAVARVEPYTWASITPNHGAFIQYVKDLKTEFDYHRTGGMHNRSDTITAIPSAYPTTPTTIYEAVTLLGALMQMIFLHVYDAISSTFTQYTATSTATSAVFTAVSPSPADNTLKDYYVVRMFGAGTTPFAWAIDHTNFNDVNNYRVTANNSGASTITLADSMFVTQTGQFILTTSFFHYGSHSTTYSGTYDPFVQHWDMNEIDLRFPSAAELQSLADLTQAASALLKGHELDRQTAVPAAWTTIAQYEPLYGRRYQRYQITDNTDADGTIITPHSPVTNKSHIFFPSSAANNSGFEEDRFDIANIPTAASVNYKAVFRYDYTVGTKSFTDRSAPSAAINTIGFLNDLSSGGSEIGRWAASVANFQVFANAANENFAHTDTTNFKKELYRTIGNGSRYFRVDADGVGGSINNSTTTLTDVTVDDFLVDQLELYTNDGAPENNRPPAATSIHIFGNTMYYALGNKVYQSVPGDPDSVPGDFFEEFEENIVGISSTKTVTVAFGSNAVYRLVGGFDDLGRGALTYERIFDRTGAISSQSIVKADNGVLFAGKDGFYFTDGYQCVRLTDLEKTFRGYTNTTAKKKSIQGTYDNISKRVYYTLTTQGGSAPDKVWVLDLKFGIKPDATPITTLSKTSGFNPTALTFFNGQIYYADADGYVFVQTKDRNLDLVKDTGTAATLWASETVRWDFKSCNHSYGSQNMRKYFTRVTSQFEQQSTNLSVQIVSDADKGRITGSLPVIRSRKLTDWGDSKIDWVSTVYPAKAGNIIDEWRMFNGDGSLRSNFRAIEFKTAYCVIVASKDMGTVTIANVAGNVYTVTLTSLVATRKWPLYSVGYFVRINSVDYPVTVRTSDSVIRIDSTGLTSPTVGVPISWEMWGYPKNERVRFIGYTVDADGSDMNETSSKGPITTAGKNP
jgi:hypothetical protein